MLRIALAHLQALVHGVPVISAETGSIPELLAGGAGLIVPAAHPEALAGSVERLLSESELRHALSVEGRRRVEEEYAVEKVVDELERRIEGATRASSWTPLEQAGFHA